MLFQVIVAPAVYANGGVAGRPESMPVAALYVSVTGAPSGAPRYAESTLPALIVALPVLARLADVRIGAAAAIFEGSVTSTRNAEAAFRVGWIRNVSFAAG